MSKFEKFRHVLLIVLIVGGLFASWAFGINQVAGILERANAVSERSVLAECVQYGAPHAIVVEGVAYCYKIYRGTEEMVPLETLQKMYRDKTPNT